MLRPSLLVAGAIALLAAAAYAWVAWRLGAHRPPDGGARGALRSFSAWWTLLAANLLLGGSLYVAAGLGYTDFAVQLTYAHAQRLLLAASLVALLHYLAYLVTGRDLLVPIAVAYFAFYAFLEWTLAVTSPYAVHVGTWRTDLEQGAAAPAWTAAVTFFGLVVPPVGAAVAHLVASRRDPDASRRYRGTLVAVALLAWWIVALAAGANLDAEPLQTVNRFLGLAAAFTILLAYEPPSWIRRRWGVRPFGEASASEA